MNFGQAIDAVKAGNRVARAEWKANNAYMRADNQALLWGSKDHREQGYHAIHADIFADDWNIVEAGK